MLIHIHDRKITNITAGKSKPVAETFQPAKCKSGGIVPNIIKTKHWKITSIILIVLIYGVLSQNRVFNIVPRAEAQNAPQVILGANIILGANTAVLTEVQIKQYIWAESIKLGADPNVSVWIAAHESMFDPTRTFDDGICKDKKSSNYGLETKSRGLFQINNCYHPEVSIACANDIKCSTEWSIKHILAGYISEWSSWKSHK